MRKKKLCAVIISLVMCTGLLAGCKKSAEDSMKRYSKCADVKEYTGVEYVPESREVTQDEIDEAVKGFCEDNSEKQQDKTKTIADGDEVNISYVETISGSEHAREDDYNITIGDDSLGAGFDEQLIGENPGNVKTVMITYPDDYEDAEVAGMEAEFEVTVNYVSLTIIPEYTDELVNKATSGEYTTTAAYTEHLTDDLQKEKDENADETDRTNVLKSVIDKTTFEKYPDDEIRDYVNSIINNMKAASSNYGIDLQTYIMYFYGYSTEPEFLEFLTKAVESVMKEKIVVASIAYKENLLANDEEIQAYKTKAMEENGIENEDEFNENYSDEDLLFYATEEKVLDFMMESAVQVEELETSEDTSEAEDASEAEK